MSAEEIAQAFTQHYYTTFDTNVAGLASMFVSHGTVPTTYGSLSMDFSRVTTLRLLFSRRLVLVLKYGTVTPVDPGARSKSTK